MPYSKMLVLARNEEVNRWLEQNPAVLGGGAIVLGGVLLGFGVRDILTQQATGKWGVKHTGGMAVFTGAVRAIAGAGLCLFGLYKLLF